MLEDFAGCGPRPDVEARPGDGTPRGAPAFADEEAIERWGDGRLVHRLA